MSLIGWTTPLGVRTLTSCRESSTQTGGLTLSGLNNNKLLAGDEWGEALVGSRHEVKPKTAVIMDHSELILATDSAALERGGAARHIRFKKQACDSLVKLDQP